MKFLRNLLATLTGLLIFTIIMIFVMMGIISIAQKEEPVKVEENTVLRLNFGKPITDREIKDPFSDLPFFPGRKNSIGLIELKDALDRAKEDENIKGVLLESPFVITGPAIMEEVRNALDEFKSSDKFIISYADFYTEGGYYMASVADEIYMPPEGFLEFNGFNAEIIFLKGTFDKLEIKPVVFRVGDYKSAVEPYIRKDLSEENREQIASFVNNIYDNMLTKIAESRALDFEKVKEISDSMLIRDAEDAVDQKFVTDLKYYDEVLSLLKEKLDVDEDDDINFMSYSKYRKSYSEDYNSNRIAVIVASGEIVWGEGDHDVISSEVFSKEIRKARKDDKVKAIVIRINSPGGNYLASDIIWKEIQEATKVKPVIASMSSYAASGGYYLAMACDTIVASPTTITGSIGIFAVLFNFQDFLDHKLGITSDRVTTGEHSDIYSGTHAMTDEQKQIIQNNLEEEYMMFARKAAEGRNLPIDSLLKLASGRVWTGTQAVENGLVDLNGGFEDAVNIAAEKADIVDDFRLKFYPVQKTILEELMSDVQDEASARMIKNELGDNYRYYELLKRMKNLRGIQARMPFEIEFK